MGKKLWYFCIVVLSYVKNEKVIKEKTQSTIVINPELFQTIIGLAFGFFLPFLININTTNFGFLLIIIFIILLIITLVAPALLRFIYFFIGFPIGIALYFFVELMSNMPKLI